MLKLSGLFAVIAITVSFVGLVLSRLLQFPLGPDRTQNEVVAFYSGNPCVVARLAIDSVCLGLIAILVAGITVLMWRVEGELTGNWLKRADLFRVSLRAVHWKCRTTIL